MDAIAEQLLARLRSDPRDRDAYEALRAHFLHGEQFAPLADLLESWALAHPEDHLGSSDAWTEAADAVLQSGGDRSRAKILYRRALELNVLHPRAGERLRELLETDTDFQGLVEVLEPYARALEAAGGAPGHVAGLYERLAELWQHAFSRADLAASYRERAELLRARAGRPSPPAGRGVDSQAITQELEHRITAEADPARKAALLCELARMRETQLNDVEGALDALRDARALAPTDVMIMHQLATTLLVHTPRGDAQAAKVAHRRASELLYQVAQAVDPAQALPYLESALVATPDHEGSLALLERLAPEQGRADMLPGAWVRFLATAGDGPETDQRRVWLGRAYLRSEQLEDAIYCLKPAADHHFEGAEVLLAEAYDRLASGQSFAGDSADLPLEAEVARNASEQPADSPELAPSGISELHKAVRSALNAKQHDQAAKLCRSILAIDATDSEAFNFLESHLRKRGDYAGLQALLLESTSVPALPLDTRRARLREVALLSEGKLRDSNAALDAWRKVAQLDPGDRDATTHYKRLLLRAQNWDELASVLEKETLATTDPREKGALLRELLQLHRERRKDVAQAAEALRRLHALEPADDAVRTELCELLISLECYREAVPVLRECIAHSANELDELRHSHALARVLHEHLKAYDEAYQACVQILEFQPSDSSTFDRMERIDTDSGNCVRLLNTLERRALLAPKHERPSLLLRMATVAEQSANDIERAAGYLGEALDIVPDDANVLQLLSDMFERGGRYERLVELLEERLKAPSAPSLHAAMLRKIARISGDQLRDEARAADAYRRLLKLENDEGALRFLGSYAARNNELPELVEILGRLAACTSDSSERRDLLLERATLLHDRLGLLAEAVASLRQILEQLDPTFDPAIDLLATLAMRARDPSALALALECQVARERDPALRLPLLKQLADVCEQELNDAARAVTALQRWTHDDPSDIEPHRRLRELLGRLQRFPELVTTLDALRELEPEAEAKDQMTLAAAAAASDHLSDATGALARLLPLLEAMQPDAIALAREIAGRHSRFADLAAIYVRLAQKADGVTAQTHHWRLATDILEHELHDVAQAFEASLRLLATDLSNEDFLARVERLALENKSYRRLTQVYDRLLKQYANAEDQAGLHSRLAGLLEQGEPEQALDRLLAACRLTPFDNTLLTRAEALAQHVHRADEVLALYDARCAQSEHAAAKVMTYLRAAKYCAVSLLDQEQAVAYLRKAVEIARDRAALNHEIEAFVREADAIETRRDEGSLRRALVQLYREAAQHESPEFAEWLSLRAASLLRDELADERSAFDVLVHASGQLPLSEPIYAAALAMASTKGQLDAIDAQLSRMLEDATDLETTVLVLQRRGMLLESSLGRHQDAANMYAKLAQIRPEDPLIGERLRFNLKKAGRYQELLTALGKALERETEPAARIGLLKDIARTWEGDLRNRWEAVDAWKAVLALDPTDSEASAGLARASRPPGVPPERSASGELRTKETPSAPARPSSSRPPPIPTTLHSSKPPRVPSGVPSNKPAENERGVDDDEADDLAALDASVGGRVPEIEGLGLIERDDDDAMTELDVSHSLPLPPNQPSRGLTVERASPPPPPPSKRSPN